ncbi:VOC family protein [Paenibacillus glycanilyticus]|uniref:VOC family protein n=1 Tax=Paenibacillus glycanilyticus TaxID=126569 RepID=A0ABQ6GHD7_9BACL|nr:VOC family protein [Paenibacillus glycanilyticus]GLX69653.1 VOC family protein [Paenibacillus glycanilyticus]
MTFQVTPFIMLNGNAKEAIQFYEISLGAKVVFTQTFGEAPEDPEQPVPNEAKDRLAHSVLKIGDFDLFVADTFPGKPNQSGNRVQICITTPDIGISNRIFDALQQGGHVIMPLQKVHFSPAYGMVTDKFGVTFQIFTQR